MKKSICFMVTQGELGGAQRYVHDLATNLDRTNYEILVVTGDAKLELSNRLKAAGISVKLAKNLVRNISPLRELAAIWELKNIIEDFKPDILHLNSTKAGILGSLAGKLAGVKNIIFTAHGFHFLEPENWLVRKISFWLEKFATLFRKKIICVSESDRQAAIKAGLCPAEKLITIHNGIDLTKSENLPPLFLPLSRSARQGEMKRGWSDLRHPKIIGTIANLYKTKGLEYLIDAAQILYTKYQTQNTKFLIIGEGRERGNLESRIRNYGLEKRIFLLGEIPNAERYLSNFDLFVLPSIKEGLPYTILEAMAAGRPIIATGVGGVLELLKDGAQGLLVPPHNPAALMKAMEKLLADRELAERMGKRARERAKEFTLERMLELTQNVYSISARTRRDSRWQ